MNFCSNEFLRGILIITTAPLVLSDLKCTGFKKCCSGYFWNETLNECTRCQVGYYAKNCRLRCPYPSFGEECQNECKCREDLCDFAFGCVLLQGIASSQASIILRNTSADNSTLIPFLEETSSTLYKWLFIATLVLCIFLGMCVFILVLNHYCKKPVHHGVYQDIFIDRTNEMQNVYESCN